MSLREPIRSIRTGIRSLPADLLTWTPKTSSTQQSSTAEPNLIVLFVPGNPGLVEYYVKFLSILQSTLPNSTSIFTLGHLGHSKFNQNHDLKSIANLQEQVDNQLKFIDELTSKYNIGLKNDQTKLVLIAHSVGSWISLEVLKQRPNLITSLNFLFPTISNMSSTPNGKRLSLLFTPALLFPLSYITSFLSLLPLKVIQSIVSLITLQKNESLLVTSNLVTSSASVSAAITLGSEEMRVITSLKPNQIQLLKEEGNRIRWYWASEGKDSWVLSTSIIEIEGILNEAGIDKQRRERCKDGMEHAFVLNDVHVDILAKKVAGWIIEDLKH